MKQLESDMKVQRAQDGKVSSSKKAHSLLRGAKLALFGIMIPAMALSVSCHGKKKSKTQSSASAYSGSGDAATAATQIDLPPKVDVGNMRMANAEIFIDAQSSNAVAWQWEQLAGPGNIVFQSPETEDTAVVADRDGFYWLRLTVTGSDGTQAFDDVQLLWDTVAPCPVLASEIKTFKSIVIDGRVASDASVIQWSQISGPGSLSFSADKASVTSIAADIDGTYVVRLSAADKVGNSCSADMTFIWETTVPTVALGQDIFTNKEIFIDAASIDARTFSWAKISGPGNISFSSAAQEDTRVSASQDGTYVLRLTITTASGVTAYDEINFTWDTTPPTIELGQ
ncbi:MAG: hypothetical protein EOP07_23700, partial [Proteobacteria bacterium]